MSTLIRGMEMPENCEECKIKRSRLSCPLTGQYVNNYRNERDNNCPLGEAPTPHVILSHIRWHEYPDEKPNLYEQVIIAGYENWRDGKGAIPFVDIATYDPNSDWDAYDIDGFSTYNDWNEGQMLWVVAWASLPEHPRIRRADNE